MILCKTLEIDSLKHIKMCKVQNMSEHLKHNKCEIKDKGFLFVLQVINNIEFVSPSNNNVTAFTVSRQSSVKVAYILFDRTRCFSQQTQFP